MGLVRKLSQTFPVSDIEPELHLLTAKVSAVVLNSYFGSIIDTLFTEVFANIFLNELPSVCFIWFAFERQFEIEPEFLKSRHLQQNEVMKNTIKKTLLFGKVNFWRFKGIFDFLLCRWINEIFPEIKRIHRNKSYCKKSVNVRNKYHYSHAYIMIVFYGLLTFCRLLNQKMFLDSKIFLDKMIYWYKPY